MIFKKKISTHFKKDEKINSELLINAYKSVRNQISIPPLNYFSASYKKRARCRLNLYALNTGIIDYLINDKIGNKGNPYINNLHKNLLEIICQADVEVNENIEELILDRNFISNLFEKSVFEGNAGRVSKTELLNNYLMSRIKEYYYAVSLTLKLMQKSNGKTEKSSLKSCPITEIFCKDFDNGRISINNQFPTQFTYNIALRGIKIFSVSIDDMFNL